MTDILKSLTAAIDELQTGRVEVPNDAARHELVRVLAVAHMEITELRKRNTDLGWQVSPDRMGGQGGAYRTDEWGNSY